MVIQPYLFFEGRAEEAANFYRDALGAQAQIMRYKDSPDQTNTPPGAADKVMHMSLKIGDAEFMGSDGMCSGKTGFQGFAISVTARDEAEAGRIFNALANGGQVQMPLTKTFFSLSFGMLADRFGVAWMVYVAQ